MKYLLIPVLVLFASCSKSGSGSHGSDTPPPVGAFYINSMADTYASVSPMADYQQWGSYNVHDPAIIKTGDYYYCYSTDVGYGIDVRAGLQIRKSKDLVEWKYVGWVFPDLPAKGKAFIQTAGGAPNNALWAPCVVKVGTQYRLYYSLSSPTPSLSVIGLATAANPEGP